MFPVREVMLIDGTDVNVCEAYLFERVNEIKCRRSR